MSSYHVLREVSGAIKRILWDAFNAEPDVRGIVQSDAGIVFTNPKRTAESDANRLSLWLYQVAENEFVKNQPMLRGDRGDTSRFPPLALDLSYLVTPMVRGESEEASHLLLGKTMQVLYDNATTLLIDRADNVAEELHIVLCRLSILELAELWEALQEDYRLSVCYLVRVTRIDSTRIPADARVLERDAAYGPLVPSPGASGR
jgi:hypothetical protein